MELYQLTIHEAAGLLNKKEVSAVELTRALLDRIATIDPTIQAYVTVTENEALAAAATADTRRTAGENGPLLGMPLAIKDVLCTKGIRTTCSSKMLEHFVPPYNAHVIERLNEAGAVIVGKTNMDEFAMGSSTENSAFFPTKNPWDLTRVPGGSSGGSAAAVAVDETLGALGSDTGGSIRQPASLCNVVGLKPTYGRVSRFGLVAFASSLDQVGPLTKDVQDAAILLQAISGYDKRDSTSVNIPVPDYLAMLNADIRGLKIGIPQEYWVEGTQPEVAATVRQAIEVLRSLGAEVGEVSLPHSRYGVAAYYIIAPAEASANLARYDGVKYGFSIAEAENMWEALSRTRQYGFGAEVKRRIMLGTYALSSGYYDAYYLRAEKVRTLIRRDFDQAFASYDVLASPVSPSVAFKLGEKIDDPYQMYLNDVFTIPANLAGICGISVPAGFAHGLPVGLQLLGRPFDEATLFRAAFAFEQATDAHIRRPPSSQ